MQKHTLHDALQCQGILEMPFHDLSISRPRKPFEGRCSNAGPVVESWREAGQQQLQQTGGVDPGQPSEDLQWAPEGQQPSTGDQEVSRMLQCNRLFGS